MRYFAKRLFTVKQTLRLLFTHHLKKEQQIRHLLHIVELQAAVKL